MTPATRTAARRSRRCLGQATLLVALSLPALPANAASALERQVYDDIMAKVTGYHGFREPKVMAACIDWDAPNFSGFRVAKVFITYTNEGSDVPVFIGRLAQDAKYRCKQWRKSEKVDCRCQMVDMNGKNVVEAPAEH